MLFLTQVQTQQPDYVALGMVIVLAIIVAIIAIRRKLSVRQEDTQPIIVAAEKPVAPGSAGGVKLHDVEPKTAAMLMAIAADKTGKPLNELRFISIKEVK